MFVDLDWPLNVSSLLSASAELLVINLSWVELRNRFTVVQKITLPFYPIHLLSHVEIIFTFDTVPRLPIASLLPTPGIVTVIRRIWKKNISYFAPTMNERITSWYIKTYHYILKLSSIVTQLLQSRRLMTLHALQASVSVLRTAELTVYMLVCLVCVW